LRAPRRLTAGGHVDLLQDAAFGVEPVRDRRLPPVDAGELVEVVPLDAVRRRGVAAAAAVRARDAGVELLVPGAAVRVEVDRVAVSRLVLEPDPRAGRDAPLPNLAGSARHCRE